MNSGAAILNTSQYYNYSKENEKIRDVIEGRSVFVFAIFNLGKKLLLGKVKLYLIFFAFLV